MEYNSFNNKEIEIMRIAVDKLIKQQGRKNVQSEDIKNIILILENFLRTHKTLCYGGTAINNILPEQDRFYNKDIEIPDYDFFSPNAIELAKKLADIYYKSGYKEVEAKAGVHDGTYKVYVNFMPIADITFLDKELFDNIYKKSIRINAINYCPVDFLRMGMYIELSRPYGDINRWEKVLKRLTLLNKNYPLKGINCNKLNFQRDYEGNIETRNKIYETIRKSVINQGLIFFGGYAVTLYGNYMPKIYKKKLTNIPDFDILAEDPIIACNIFKEQLIYENFKNIKIVKKKPIGEYIDEHYEISIIINNITDVIAVVYKTSACHSYNTIYINGEKLKIATIDTILSFYLIFIYANRQYYDINRLLCMSEYLFKVQYKNRLKQKGLLRRFSIDCYGKQKTLEDIRSEKSKMFKILKDMKLKSGDKNFDKYFLRYIPNDNVKKNKTKKNKTKKK
tara:strand:- start:342 stop:1694 length:1353 start_codon:yes stop_codon:yes gene_type:complete